MSSQEPTVKSQQPVSGAINTFLSQKVLPYVVVTLLAVLTWIAVQSLDRLDDLNATLVELRIQQRILTEMVTRHDRWIMEQNTKILDFYREYQLEPRGGQSQGGRDGDGQ